MDSNRKDASGARKRRSAGLWVAVAVVAACWPALCAAQAYPCGSGPGPGEVQVGVSGGSNGIAATPMCAPAGGGGGGDSGPRRAPSTPDVPVDNYIAVAAHPDLPDVWATWGQYRLQAAETVVLDACKRTLGEGCAVLESGANLAVAVAHDAHGRMRAASAGDPRQARRALEATCKRDGARCAGFKTFHAPLRGESPFSAILRDDLDKEGLFKEYYFPPRSSVPRPKLGTPDAGVGVGGRSDALAKLPSVPGIRKVHHSVDGTWLLRQGDRKGLGCSLIYFREDQRVMFVGPSAADPRGALAIASKRLAPITQAREARATMRGDRGEVEVRVVHVPVSGQESMLLMPTDLAKTIASISDSSPLQLELEGRAVLDMQIQGGIKARGAMQQCLLGH